MNELQKELYNIYLEFDAVCKKIGVTYFAAYGTLLGAIRHNGFIPWDDDMDFFMLRKDYDIFCREAPKVISNEFFVQCHQTDKKWMSQIVKVRKNNTTAIEPFYKNADIHHGIWIDIFALDKMPESKKAFKQLNRAKNFYGRRMKMVYHPKQTFFGKLLNLLFYIVCPSSEFAYKQSLKTATKFKNSNILSLVCYTNAHPYIETYMDEVATIHYVAFEDGLMPVPSGWERILNRRYGDWKKLPPVEERGNGSAHTIEILDLNNGYEKYIKRNHDEKQ